MKRPMDGRFFCTDMLSTDYSTSTPLHLFSCKHAFNVLLIFGINTE